MVVCACPSMRGYNIASWTVMAKGCSGSQFWRKSWSYTGSTASTCHLSNTIQCTIFSLSGALCRLQYQGLSLQPEFRQSQAVGSRTHVCHSSARAFETRRMIAIVATAAAAYAGLRHVSAHPEARRLPKCRNALHTLNILYAAHVDDSSKPNVKNIVTPKKVKGVTKAMHRRIPAHCEHALQHKQALGSPSSGKLCKTGYTPNQRIVHMSLFATWECRDESVFSTLWPMCDSCLLQKTTPSETLKTPHWYVCSVLLHSLATYTSLRLDCMLKRKLQYCHQDVAAVVCLRRFGSAGPLQYAVQKTWLNNCVVLNTLAQPWYPSMAPITMAPRNGTHPPYHGTHHPPPKSQPPSIGSKNPYSYRHLGKNTCPLHFPFFRDFVFCALSSVLRELTLCIFCNLCAFF